MGQVAEGKINTRAYVLRTRAPKFKRCGMGGCTTLAPFVLMAGSKPQLYCCAQCASVGVNAAILNKVVGAPKAPALVIGPVSTPSRELIVLNSAEEAREYFGHSGYDHFYFPARVTIVRVGDPSTPTRVSVTRSVSNEKEGRSL